MNKKILNTGVQSFINKNLNADIVSVLLKKPVFDDISQKELAQQIESKKKSQKKLPTWFNTPGIYYPKKVNIEQTSSEIAAQYKSEIVNGKSLIDLTGGLGIDSYYFSKKIASIFHCEINQNLHEIASHNFRVLDAKNILTFSKNGLELLEESNQKFDWIYFDPSRRNEVKGKVFKLSDCEPDISENLELLFAKSEKILLKTSPLLDISVGLKELEGVKEIHVVAVNNDVKELLWILNKGFDGEIKVKTINISNSKTEHFNFLLSDEKRAVTEYGIPLSYLYEPNAAILKSGAFKSIGVKFGLIKLHPNTHLYTSKELLGFPGRRFKILKVLEYNTKSLKELNISKANITTRNFPKSVATIRKKHKIADGGDMFMFFFRDDQNKLQMALCRKN